jgi:hypothetical protein
MFGWPFDPGRPQAARKRTGATRMPFMYDGQLPGVTSWDPQAYESAVRYWVKDQGCEAASCWSVSSSGSRLCRTSRRPISPASGTPNPKPRTKRMRSGRELVCDRARTDPPSLGRRRNRDRCHRAFHPAHLGGAKRDPARLPAKCCFLNSFILCQTSGTTRCIAAGNRMDTQEEIIAIAIVNLYASERGRPARRDHNGFKVLPGDPQAGWVQQKSGVPAQLLSPERETMQGTAAATGGWLSSRSVVTSSSSY